MPGYLTIIIPTLNAAHGLPDCFAHLMPGIVDGTIAKVIVVDGGSTDDTCTIAREWGADVLTHSTGSRGGQLRAGAAAARTPWMMFLHADTRLSAEWVDEIEGLPSDHPSCFLLKFHNGGWRGKLVAAWANFRTWAFALPYGDQGLLISRVLYDQVGGYPDIPLMEDVAIMRAMPTRPHILRADAATDASKYNTQGWLRRGSSNLILLIRYLLGESPEKIAKRY